MGLGSAIPDDSSTDEDDSSGPGVSYLYIRGEGHDSNGEGFNPTARDKLRGKGEFSTTRGVADFCKKVLPGYGDQHDFFSQIVADLHAAINDDDYSGLFETLMVSNEQADLALDVTEPDAKQIGRYLEANPQVQQTLVNAMAEHEDIPLQRVESDDDEAEADDEETEAEA
jgi:hypothetical protein